MTGPADIDFLRELVRLTDEKPGDRVTGSDIATNIGLDDALTEPTVQRLKQRGLIEFAPGPQRMGDGWTSTSLAMTPDGYRHVEGG